MISDTFSGQVFGFCLALAILPYGEGPCGKLAPKSERTRFALPLDSW